MVRWLLGFVVGLLAASVAHADSWALPERTLYTSPHGTARLTVSPRALKDQLAYYEDKVKGREPAGQRAGETHRTARATLERKVDGKWTTVWTQPLVNEVAPVAALVSDDGAHVVTFDNWGSTGYGDDVVVIYAADGRVVRAMGLRQIVPEIFVEALPRTVSSLQWRGDSRFAPDGRNLLVAVVVPDDDAPLGRDRATIDIRIDLATGAVTSPSGPAWNRALAQARKVTAARTAGETARKAAFVGPLVAPAATDDGDWHRYLEEAFFRLDPEWKRSYPAARVLRSPSARDYPPSERWVREALADPSRVVMFASPAAPDRLVAVMQDAVQHLPPSRLKRTRIYLAVPPKPARLLAAALRPAGVILDPATPVPQRPERLRGETPADDLRDMMDDPEGDASGPD